MAPDGSAAAWEWVARNPVRGDRAPGSFGVSLSTGRWNDFAADDARGGDLVSLLAYLTGCSQLEAARQIDARLGVGAFGPHGVTSQACPDTSSEAAAAKRAREEAAAQERRERQAEAARQATEWWQMAKPAARDFPYLVDKGVRPLLLRQLQGRLLVPLYHGGQLVNLQTIDRHGRKLFLPGGLVSGAYSPIGQVSPGGRIYVCEGWATGATLHMATGSPVACAMNAGNLKPVALALRARHGSDVELVIAGDDDRARDFNPGRMAANSAAREAGALVVFPEWPPEAPTSLSDFNDLARWQATPREGRRA